jgi:hypothetical protein
MARNLSASLLREGRQRQVLISRNNMPKKYKECPDCKELTKLGSTNQCKRCEKLTKKK